MYDTRSGHFFLLSQEGLIRLFRNLPGTLFSRGPRRATPILGCPEPGRAHFSSFCLPVRLSQSSIIHTTSPGRAQSRPVRCPGPYVPVQARAQSSVYTTIAKSPRLGKFKPLYIYDGRASRSSSKPFREDPRRDES